MRLYTSNPIGAFGGARLVYLIPENQLPLLRERHFRGRNKAVAGNFAFWETPLAAFNALHTSIESLIVDSILEKPADGELPIEGSIELKMKRPIGWTCTAPLDRFGGETFPVRRLSSHRHAQIVQADRQDLLAPSTDLVTCIFKARPGRRGDWLCTLYNLRPGEDFNAEDGDLTEKTGLVIYPFGHPGEPFPLPQVQGR